ncbi:MAG: thiamine phosphate synthase [Planctomycetaceae bacterium]
MPTISAGHGERLSAHRIRADGEGALDGGVDAIQLREKGIDDRRLLELAERVRTWTTDAGALFV